MESYNTMDPAAMGAAWWGIMFGSFIISLIFYVFLSWCLMKIANRTGTANGWFAWLPILNLILILDIAQKPRVWALAIIVVPVLMVILAFIPILGAIVSFLLSIGLMVAFGYILMEVAEAVGKPKYWGIIALLVAPVGFGYLAFAD